MAWEDDYDYYEPEHFRASDYDTIDYSVARQHETEKAILYKFHNLDGEAWVPKSVIERIVIEDSKTTITVPDWFKPKIKNKIKEVELDIFSKQELDTIDEPRLTYDEWLEEYKKRGKAI